MGTFGDTSDIISSTVDKIVTTVNETQDAFIFSTLSSYAAEQYTITVEKEELTKAILFIRACKETGTDLRNYCATAVNATELYRKGYNAGYKDGYDGGFTAGLLEARVRLENTFKEENKNK